MEAKCKTIVIYFRQNRKIASVNSNASFGITASSVGIAVFIFGEVIYYHYP
jgi:hypothetical protein